MTCVNRGSGCDDGNNVSMVFVMIHEILGDYETLVKS